MIKNFDEFINESKFGNRYGNNNLNRHLRFALLKVRDFCDEQNLVYQTAGAFCDGLKFDKINIFKDGTKNIGSAPAGAKEECIARVYGDDEGNVIYWCDGVEYKTSKELFDAVLKCR